MERIGLFYATNNQSKLHNMHYRLRKYPVDIFSPAGLKVTLSIKENGNTAIENALIKVTEYYRIVNMPTIAGDTGMYIKGLDKDKRPGLYVRRVNGKVLSDDEMIDYYSNLAKQAKTDCFINYFTGIALITSQGTFTLELKDAPLKLSPVPNSNRKHRGNPLDVISITDDGRYFNDVSDYERTELDSKGEKAFTDFVIKHLIV